MPPPPPRIHIQYPQPVVDAGKLPRQADGRRPRRGLRRRVPRRPREAPRRRRPPPPRRAQVARGGAACARRPHQRRALGRLVRRRPSRAAGSSRSRPGPTSSPPGATSCGASSRPASTISRGELSEGVLLLQDVAERAKGADRKLIEHALRVLTDEEILEAAKHDAALGLELYAAVERNAERHGVTRLEPLARASRSTASAPASAPGTSCSRARGAGWRACRRRLPAARRARLRRDLPDRRSTRSA